MRNNKKFIEVVPIYPLPIPIQENEDYFTWPVKMMGKKGYDTEIVTRRYHNQKASEIVDGVLIKRFDNVIKFFIYIYLQRKNLIYAQGKYFPAFVGLICNQSIYAPHCSFGQTLPKYFNNPLMRLITKLLWSRFNKIVANTPYETEVYKKLGFRKNYIQIYNAVDFNFFSNQKRSEKILKKYHIGHNQKVILFVGNIHANVKNIDILYSAFQLVRKKVDNTLLMIIGKEIDLLQNPSFFKRLKDDRFVILTGWQPPEIITQALSVASVFVNTSTNEGQCLAVSEAASAGIPLCLSKIGTFTFVYKKWALYHNPFDYKKLAENIILYLNNKPFVSECIKNNRLTIKDKFDFKVVQNKIYRLFRSNEY